MRIFIVLVLFTLKVFPQKQLTKEQLSDIRKSITLEYVKSSFESTERLKEFYISCEWSFDMQVTHIEDNFKITDSTWTYYEVIVDHDQFSKNDGNVAMMVSTDYDSKQSKWRRSLIAIDENKEIIYLGGAFQRSSISHRFGLDSSLESFYKYLQIKYYNYSLEKIKKLKTTNKSIHFKAFSLTLMKDVFIKVNRSNYDDLEILE